MRRRLANRHQIESISLYHDQHKYDVSFSRFPNGNIAEVFVSGGKVGSPLQAISRDIGIAISIMLQHGMLISDISSSMTKLDDGSPAGPLGAILERLHKEW